MQYKLRHRLLCLVTVVVQVSACGSDSEDSLLASAQKYSGKREYTAAVIELKRALQKDPNSGRVRLALGKTLLDSGDPVAAEVELRKALEAGADEKSVLPVLAHAMLFLGQPSKLVAQFGSTTLPDPAAQAELKTWLAAAHGQQGDVTKAREEVAAALQMQPQYAPAVMVQARLNAMSGDVDAALRRLDEYLVQHPDDEDVGLAKGYLLWFGKHDTVAALEAQRKVLAAHPGSVAAQAEIVSLLFREGKTAESRQQFDLLKRSAPNNPQTIYFEAQFAYLDRNYRRAREILDPLLKALPDHLLALELAAATEYQLGHDEQVQVYAKRALKQMPGLGLSSRLLAMTALRAGLPADALQALAPLTSGENADAESLALAGNAYLQSGDVKKADLAFRQAAERAPGNPKVRTQAALAMFDSGRSEAALRELEAVAAADQGPQADLALVSARIAQQDLRGALKAIDALQPKMPGQPLPEQLRGQVLVAMRDADGARRSFEAARAKNAAYFPAVAALATMDMAQGKNDAARQRLTDFLVAQPKSSSAMIMLGEVLLASGAAPQQAVDQMSKAVGADPGSRAAHLALIRLNLQLGNNAAALSAARAAEAALPDDPAIQQALGQTQLLSGNAEQALSTFRKIAASQPRDAQAQMNLAEAYVAAKDAGGAGLALKRALELDPARDDARRGLAMLALQQKHPDEALAITREMQKLRPQGALGYGAEGDIQAQQRNWAAAALAYRTALRYSEASEAAIKLHVALRAAGKRAEADQVAADWEKRRPKDPAFRYYLGDVAMQAKDYGAAEGHYRAVLASQPRNALAMNNIAWLMVQRAEPGALQMAQQADVVMPDRAPILDTLAMAQAAAGKLSDAIQTQQRAVTRSPQDPGLKLKLARYLVKAGRRDEARTQLDALAVLGDGFHGHAEVTELLRSM